MYYLINELSRTEKSFNDKRITTISDFWSILVNLYLPFFLIICRTYNCNAKWPMKCEAKMDSLEGQPVNCILCNWNTNWAMICEVKMAAQWGQFCTWLLFFYQVLYVSFYHPRLLTITSRYFTQKYTQNTTWKDRNQILVCQIYFLKVKTSYQSFSTKINDKINEKVLFFETVLRNVKLSRTIALGSCCPNVLFYALVYYL